MPDENNYGGVPILDDIDYVPTPKKEGPQGVSAPVLDDIEYTESARRGAPKGVSAPVLETMDTYNPAFEQRRGAPTGVTAPVLDDMDNCNPSYEPTKKETSTEIASEKLILSDEDIISALTPELKTIFDNLSDEQQQKIINMRREQLGAEAPPEEVTAPVLDEDNYVPPPVKEEPPKPVEPVTAPVLDEEPEPPKYVPKFVDEDLERAKREGAKKAVASQLTSNQKDSKESLRMMLELKEQRNAELAKKGFKITIVIAIIGVIGAVAFYMLYAGKLGLDYKSSLSGIGNIIKESALYISVITSAISLLMITGAGAVKSLASFVFLVFGIIQIFPGAAMIPQHNGSMSLAGILYAISIGCTVAVFIILSASETVGLYFKKKK